MVDANYCGEVGVVLFNHGDQDFEVKMEDRIAQVVLEKVNTPKVEEVQGSEETVHGSRGFGSFGVKTENDTDGKKELKGEKERTEKKDEVKNGTLKDKVDSGKRSTNKSRKSTEGTSKLSRERQIISVK